MKLQFKLVHLLVLMALAGVLMGVYPYYMGVRTAVVKFHMYEIDGDPERRYADRIEMDIEFVGPPELVKEHAIGKIKYGFKGKIEGIPRSLFTEEFLSGDEIRFRYQHFDNLVKDAEDPQLILLRRMIRDSDPDESMKAKQVIEWMNEGRLLY